MHRGPEGRQEARGKEEQGGLPTNRTRSRECSREAAGGYRILLPLQGWASRRERNMIPKGAAE